MLRRLTTVSTRNKELSTPQNHIYIMKTKIPHLILATGVMLFMLPGTASAQTTFTWDGGGGDGNWTTATNWVGDVVPVEADGYHNFVFDGTSQLNSNVDIVPGNNGLNTNDLIFNAGAGAFTLSGSSFDLLGTPTSNPRNIDTAKIINNSANTQTINNSIYHHTGYNEGLVFDNTNGGAIVVNGVIQQSSSQADDVTIQGNGTVTFNGVNTYTRDTTLSSGTLIVGDSSALGTGTATLAGGTLRTDTAAATIALSNAIDASGTTNVFAGSVGLNLSGDITGSGTLVIGGSGSGQGSSGVSITDNLDGFTGKIIFDSVANLNSFSFGDGNTVNTTAALEVNGTNNKSNIRLWEHATFGELSGNGGNFTGDNSTLTINQDTDTTFGGQLLDVNSARELGFTKGGSGRLTLSGQNSYEWDTIVNGGTLEVSGRIGETERITVAGGAAFEVTGSGSLGSGGVYSGGGSGTGNIVNNGTFTYNSTTDQTFTGVVSGSGALIKDNSSTLTLSGANTFSGATTIDGGELVLSGSAGGGHRSATTVANGATLSFASTGDINNTQAGRSIVLQDGSTLQNTSPNDFVVLGAVGGGTTVDTGASVTINLESNAGARTGFYLDDGLKSTGADTTATVTINATNAGNGVNLRNNNTTFAGTLIVNGIASATEGAGSGIGVAGNTTGLQNADIQLNGTMELMKSSNNNLAISWANNNGGTFQMGALSGTGVMVGNNGTAGGTALVTLGNTDNDGTFSGVIANGVNNTTSITKVGTGTQTLSGSNSYTGLTTVNDGTLTLAAAAALSGTGGNYQINNDATLQTTVGINVGGRTFTFGDGGSGTINFTGGNMAINGTTFVTTGGSTNYISGSLLDLGTPVYDVADGTDAVDLQVSNSHNRAGITKNGAGTLSLTSTANNLQTNVLDINAGVVELGGAGRLVNGNYSGNITNDAIFRHNSTNNQNLNGVISGTGAIEKDNTGTLTLTGANTYSGTTTVSNGTLTLSAADNNIANSTSIDVASGATLDVSGITNGFALANGQTLSGAGTVTGGMTIALGSVISPGNSPGTLSTGAQTWNDGGSYLWEINASNDAGGTQGADPGWDWLDITGSLDLSSLTAGGFTIDIDSLTSGNIAGDAVGFDTWTKGSPGDVDYSFTIATASSGITGFDADNFTLDSSGFSNAPSWDWQIVLSGSDLVLEAYAVPEPSSAALLGLGGLALMLRRKRS